MILLSWLMKYKTVKVWRRRSSSRTKWYLRSRDYTITSLGRVQNYVYDFTRQATAQQQQTAYMYRVNILAELTQIEKKDLWTRSLSWFWSRSRSTIQKWSNIDIETMISIFYTKDRDLGTALHPGTRLHLFPESRGKRWSLNIIYWFCRFPHYIIEI